MSRKFAIVAVSLALLLFVGLQWYKLIKSDSEVRTVEASVLLEQVREVCKLVTVEGEFNELYTEKNMREVTLYLPIPTYWEFTKEAIIEVRGRVLVGYDMEQLSIKVDSLNRLVTLSNLPQPDILAVDHELAYRNLEESFFNSFTVEDYTQLNRNAKEVLRKQAHESGLLEKARAEGNTMLESIRFMVENMGWNLEYEQAPQLSPSSSTNVSG